MKITFHEHGGKGARIAAALKVAGHETVPAGGDLALIDHDYYSHLCDAHEVVVLYPHGGNPILSWDGNDVHPNVRLNLVHAPGHAEVMAAYGFGVPTVPVGWCFSDLAEPRSTDACDDVLFAPEHPLANGYLAPELVEVNRRVLAALLEAAPRVSVRIFGPASGYGLDPAAPVRWVPGGSLAHGDIDRADLVVATGTVLHLAVARGAPTLTFGADLVPDIGHDGQVQPPRWESYRQLYRYPYDLDDAPLAELVDAVRRPGRAVANWRERFVGAPFDAALAVRLIEEAAERKVAA